MKRKLPFLILLVFLCNILYSQDKKFTQKAVQLFEQRTIHLNGGNATTLNPGKKSRVFIQIDLPPNTIEWYYSFSTSNNQSSIDNLNLLIQLGGLALSNTIPLGSTLSSSSITKTALSKIKIPYGSHAIDAYLCDRTNIDKFKEKGDNWGNPFSYIIKGSAENTTQGLIRVNNVTSGTYYIGLKNPSLTNAVDIIIEGVAIIASEETFQQSDEQGKAVLYGNMGWKAFEKGEYGKCLEYSQKAIQLDPTLAWVKLNISLTYLVQEEPEYLDSYIDAILACKKSDHPKEFLQAGLKDIYDIKNKRTLKKSDEEVIELITNELSRLK